MTQPPSPSAATRLAEIRERLAEYPNPIKLNILSAYEVKFLLELLDMAAAQNPCTKIFSHKWLDPECVENGCQTQVIKRDLEGACARWIADGVAAEAPKTLVSVCPHPAKCEEMAWAAERAKPAASDREAAHWLAIRIRYTWNISQSVDELAAALAERGERERERAAQVAECFDLGTPDGHAIAAAIRNQTLPWGLA